MFNCSNFDGQWCTLEEESFLRLLEDDLTCYLNQRKFNKVLVFPPLLPRLRFLLHKVVESYPNLASHSIGQEPNRRTAVFFVKKSLKRNAELMSTSPGISQESLNRCSSRGRGRGRGRGRVSEREGKVGQLGNNVSLSTGSSNECYSPKNSPRLSQRPAQKLYQPGAFRKMQKDDGSFAGEKDSTAVQSSCGSNLNKNEKRKIENPLQWSSTNKQLPDTRMTLRHYDGELSSGLKVGGTQVDPVSTHVDLVSTQVDHISTQVDHVSTLVDLVSTQVDPVSTHVDPVSTQVDHVSTQVDHVSTQVDPVRTQVDHVSTQVDLVSTQVDPISTQVDHVSTQVDHVSTQVDLVRTQVDHVRTQVDPVSTHVDLVSTQVDHVSTQVDHVSTQVDHVSTQVDPVSTQVDHVRTQVDHVSTQVDPFSIQLDHVRTQVDHVSTQVDHVSTQVNPVSTSVDPVSTLVDPVSTQVDHVRTQVDHVSTQVDPVSTQVDHVSTQVDPVGTQVDPVSTQMDPVSTQVDHVSTQVDPVGTQVDPVSTQVDPVSTQVDPVSTQVDPVSTQVDPVSTQVDHNVSIQLAVTENKVTDCTAPTLGKSGRKLRAENSVENDRTKLCPSNYGRDKEDPNFAEEVDSIEVKDLKGKCVTNLNQRLASNNDTTCVKDLGKDNLNGQEEGAVIENTQVNNRIKQKSKRQCKKEEKVKKKDGKLKKKSKVVQKLATANLEKDLYTDKIKVKETTDKQCSERKDMEDKKKEKDEDDKDWESNWGETGECLNSEMLAELNEAVDVTDVDIQKPKFDYLSFKPKDIVLDSGVYDHVVELYDFSPELKTHDLVHALSKFKLQGVDIHWVNDTHALAVFSHHKTAQSAIEECSNPMLKMRPLYEGTHESKLKAKREVDFLQPYKERPKTSKLVANRLVSGALGIRSKMSKEERQLEREKIKAEREKKLEKAQQKKDLWESEDLDS